MKTNELIPFLEVELRVLISLQPDIGQSLKYQRFMRTRSGFEDKIGIAAVLLNF